MSFINNEQKMLDILFANRNKSYGAYAIRSAYGSTVFRSLFIVAFTVFSSAGLAYWLKETPMVTDGIGQIIPPDERVISCKLPDPAEQPKEIKKADTKPAGSSSKNITSTLIKNNAVDSAKQALNTQITSVSNNTTTGDPGPITPSITGGSGGTATVEIASNDPKDWVDENPEFEGGHAALLAFVRKNLVYPGMAASEGRQGTLYAKFVVDETGKVSNIFLQNNLGYGLDDEAMRVLKMIPKFKSPGKVKGQPVKTYYQIPIKFKLG